MNASFLVTGAGGQLGRALLRHLGALARGLSHGVLDIADDAAVAAALAQYRPAVVVNCAAFSDVDQAESEPGAAFAANARGPETLARACAADGVAFVHLSTDYVFDGRGGPYREDDPPAPLGIYGASKLVGERAVLASGARAVVLRTSWLFDGVASGFVAAVLRQGRERSRLTMVVDQVNCPTPATALAAVIADVSRHLANGGPGGLYHYCGRPPVSRLAWARAILDAAGLDHVVLDPTTRGHFGADARRPARSVLDCTRIGRDFGIDQPDWHAALVADLARTEQP